MINNKKIQVLFVCMGNICRSPTAEGVFRELVNNSGYSEDIITDSAGTHAYHVGEQPDARAQATALTRGIDLSDLRARRAIKDDFDNFDYVLAMDMDNFQILKSICPSKHINKLKLFLDFTSEYDDTEVPDPYYGGDKGFEYVFDLVESASNGLLKNIKARYFK
ncbi:Low molecular weight protein tyrosine phosphatase [hydrothermal vent metagenome]|uniref:protein-tyrosine-phosphatase n=1 Tax=hydrothermal vent metagenome TaxID=652676 RepID=A0A3B0ZRP9_9ZZZZ